MHLIGTSILMRDADPVQASSRLIALQAEFPGYEITRQDGAGRYPSVYVAVARHPRMWPPVAQAGNVGELRALLETPMMPLDTSVANQARVYDYWLGGKDHFEPDRLIAGRVEAAYPGIRDLAVQNKQFLTRAVRWVAARGVTQFLDLGAGMPTQAPAASGRRQGSMWLPVHVAAREIQPQARTVYIDYDPVVIRHSWAMLTGHDPGTEAAGGDLRDPEVIWSLGSVNELLNVYRPIGLVLGCVFHFMPADQARGVAAHYAALLPPGSYVIISMGAASGASSAQAVAAYNGTGDDGGPVFHNHTRAQIGSLFETMELIDPGIVPAGRWRPGWREPALDRDGASILGGVAYRR